MTAISSPSADGKVYIGGFFTHVNSAERSHLAAVDGLTGALTSFDPNVDGTVEAISVNGPTVYAGGVFATVNGSLTRNGLAAFDATTGTATSFDPNLQFGPEAGESWSLLMVGSTLYAGGLFTTVNGSTPRNSLAAFDAPTGSVTSFDPNVRKGPGLGIVNDLALAGTTLYFGGSFDTVNGTTARNAVAAVDTTTGAVTSFDPNITGALGVAFDLALAGSDLYVAGEFSKVNGNTARTSLAAFDRNTGVATGFNPDLHPQEGNFEVDVYTVGVNGDEAFAGGRFVSAGGVARNHLAAIYLPTGQPTSFDPNVSGPVEALAVKGPLLYAGGAFATVNGGNVRSYLAAFDASTGTTTNFHPVIDGIVDAIAVSGATVYAGGAFRNAFVGGGLTRRNHLAAFDAASGAPTGFDPDVNGDVTALAVSGSTVYAGGDFTAVNGASPRNRLAAFDASTGSATSFDPNVNDTVLSLAVDGATLYAGGFFTTVNGSATRNGLAAFNSATGVATAFDPNVNGVVVGVLLLGSSVYAGGGFRTANGATSRLNLASFDKASGQLRGWDPSPGGLVYALAQGDGMLLAGGAFSSLVAPGLVLTTPNLLALNGLARQPTNVTAAAGDGQAIVSFDAIAPAGDNPDLTYVVTASPGGQTATRTGSPITVTGLANGTTYTFRVQSSTEFGRSAPSAASNSVTPTGPASGGGTGGGGGGGGGGSGGGGGGGGGSYPDLQVALTASAATVPAVGSELDFFATVSMKNRATSRRDGSG